MICAMDEYDEGLLKKQFQSGEFALAKHRLYKIMLKSLVAYNDTDDNNDINLELYKAGILKKKRLDNEFFKRMTVLKERALSLDKYETAAHIISIEKNIALGKVIYKQSFKGIADFFGNLYAVIDKSKELNKYHELYWRASIANNTNDKVKTKKIFDSIIASEYLQDGSKAGTFRMKIFFHNIWSVYYDYLGDTVNSHKETLKLKELFEKHPEIIDDNPSEYLTLLYNLFEKTISLKCYKESRLVIASINRVPASEEETGLYRDALSLSATLELCRKMLPENSAKYIDDIIKQNGIRKILSGIRSPLLKMVIMFRIASLLFVVGKCRQAFSWCNRIISEFENYEVFAEMLIMANVMKCMIGFDTGDHAIVESILRSLSRRKKYLTQRENKKYLLLIISYFEKLNKDQTIERYNRDLSVLKNKLEHFDCSTDEVIFGFVDIISWIESKIEDRPIAEIIRKKAQQIRAQ